MVMPLNHSKYHAIFLTREKGYIFCKIKYGLVASFRVLDLKATTIVTVYKIKVPHESAAKQLLFDWSHRRFLADRVAYFW